MAYENATTTPMSHKIVPLGARAEILPSVALPELNSPGGPAFAGRLKGDANSSLMAILCNSGLPARLDVITSMRSVDHPSLLKLVDSGVVPWPGDEARYFAFAFQRPLSPRLKNTFDEPHPVMSEDTVNHYFIAPMIGALAELERTGVVHNAIRPTNMFWRMGAATPPQIGECLSAPAGYGQPALFETLERAMSVASGRGPGSHSDDCYAFGVTLALMVLGLNPLQGLDDRAIVQMKMERGTFGSLIGSHRLPASQIEILRGLLTDDAQQRWTATDLEQWQNGRRLTPKNTDAGKRASRSFAFAGKDYWQVRPLAHALATEVRDAVRLIEDGTLDKWLRRALVDEERADDLAEAVTSLKESGKTANYEDQVVARACIALDPAGPLHYRGLTVMPGGIANMMVEAISTGTHVQILSEIIASQLVTLWVDMQKESKTELVPLAQQFERMRGVIEKSSFGNGFERVLYELNPALPCLSPIVRAQCVTTPKTLLPALERVAASGSRGREPMDRHIAAFLIVRDRRSELLFDAMAAPEMSPRRGLALLTLLGEMQYRYGPDALPNLGQWLLPLLDPCLHRYLGKGMIAHLQKQMKETVERGDLSNLLRLLDDPKRVERDQQEFMAARMLYLNTLKEITILEGKLADRDGVVSSVGKPLAASISSLLAIILVVVAGLRALWQNVF